MTEDINTLLKRVEKLGKGNRRLNGREPSRL